MYQNKTGDRVTTPSNLLLLSMDTANRVNFLNFNVIGINSLKESSAFSTIRNTVKVYNANLVYAPSDFSSKYTLINSLYANENTYFTTSSFGVKRQHNLASNQALGNSTTSTYLDRESFNKLASLNLGIPSLGFNLTPLSMPTTNALTPTPTLSIAPNTPLITELLNKQAAETNSIRIASYPTLLSIINDNSDKGGLNYPSLKVNTPKMWNVNLLNSKTVYSHINNREFISLATPSQNYTATNNSTNPRVYSTAESNDQMLGNDQSIRNFPKVLANKSNFNFSLNTNTVASNLLLNIKNSKVLNPFSLIADSTSGFADLTTFSALASSRSLMLDAHPAVITSSRLKSNSLNYDSTRSTTHLSFNRRDPLFAAGLSSHSQLTKKSLGSEVFTGSRENIPKAINSAY
jgi:hypothetical protein